VAPVAATAATNSTGSNSEPGQRRFHGPLSEVDGGDDNVVSQAVGDEAVEQEEGYGVRGSRRQLRWSGGGEA
jgi:hypothetical protein